MECGDCTACCTLSVVPELHKGAGEQCIHCINNSCEIYGKHPQLCKEFECAYLQGGSVLELRPDKCGVMFFKKSDKIFCGVLVPDVPITDTAKGQVDSFKKQGYSVVLLNLGERPHVIPAEGCNEEEVYKEYLNIVVNGYVQH